MWIKQAQRLGERKDDLTTVNETLATFTSDTSSLNYVGETKVSNTYQ